MKLFFKPILQDQLFLYGYVIHKTYSVTIHSRYLYFN